MMVQPTTQQELEGRSKRDSRDSRAELRRASSSQLRQEVGWPSRITSAIYLQSPDLQSLGGDWVLDLSMCGMWQSGIGPGNLTLLTHQIAVWYQRGLITASILSVWRLAAYSKPIASSFFSFFLAGQCFVWAQGILLAMPQISLTFHYGSCPSLWLPSSWYVLLAWGLIDKHMTFIYCRSASHCFIRRWRRDISRYGEKHWYLRQQWSCLRRSYCPTDSTKECALCTRGRRQRPWRMAWTWRCIDIELYLKLWRVR